MRLRIHAGCVALALLAVAPRLAAAQGYKGYPYTIMTPEPGGAHHRGTPARTRHIMGSRGHSRTVDTPVTRRALYAARGSSGSVLPTPLPRTPLIPPEGGGVPTIRAAPQQQGLTVLPGRNPIPNLPHGNETFQDRASRCAFQQGLYNVPGGATTQYMGACLQ